MQSMSSSYSLRSIGSALVTSSITATFTSSPMRDCIIQALFNIPMPIFSSVLAMSLGYSTERYGFIFVKNCFLRRFSHFAMRLFNCSVQRQLSRLRTQFGFQIFHQPYDVGSLPTGRTGQLHITLAKSLNSTSYTGTRLSRKPNSDNGLLYGSFRNMSTTQRKAELIEARNGVVLVSPEFSP